MIHYKKSGFSIKSIEYNDEFKSFIDEVADETGIEMNYANPDDHVTEADKSNKVIKERFRIVYYRLPYKKYQGLRFVN